jgi:hypothetical protein
MSSDLQQQAHRVNEKLQQLLKQYLLVQKNNDLLREELQQVKKLNEAKTRQLDELEQRVAILKTATNNLLEPDKKALDKRLNHYLKEIDKCITLLSE